MQVVLTASDLAAMPTGLRQELLAYLATRRKLPLGGSVERRRASETAQFNGLAALDRDQALALVRDVSFGRKLKGLHDLLEALAYEKDGDAPGVDRLTRLLKLDDARHLRRYFAACRRLLKQVTREAAPITRYSRQTGTYLVHPTTRASLREVFATLTQSGEGEEPPWA
jgi:hypothetical protein